MLIRARVVEAPYNKQFFYSQELPKLPKDIYFQLVDGTRIESEEYFQSLPSQTTIVWVEVGKTADTGKYHFNFQEQNSDWAHITN